MNNFLSNMFGGGNSSLNNALIVGTSNIANNNSAMVNAAQLAQTSQIEMEQTQMAMAAYRERAEWDKWKLLQDTQTKIYEIQQEVAINKAKTQEKMFQKWDEVVKS
jgi:hypothetical protein